MSQPLAIQKLQSEENSPKPNGLFPAGLTIDQNFGDIDELATAVRDWDEEAIQLQPGQFRGRLSLVHTSHMQIHRGQLSSEILVRGSAAPGTVVFGLQTNGARPSLWRDRPIESDSVVVFDGHTEINFQTTCPSEITVVAIEANILAQHVAVLNGRELAPAAYGSQLKIASQAKVKALIQCWSEMTDMLLKMGHRLTEEHFARDLEMSIIEALQVNAWCPRRETQLAERRRTARRAQEFMLENRDQPMTIVDICREVRAAERTLHLGFRECFGTTPKRFLKVLRLNAARRCLRHPEFDTTVTDVAIQFGFFHFANFAGDYKRLFAESPSQTLRNARGTGR
jgi:AraC family ethanolamine operon transcriptional activator